MAVHTTSGFSELSPSNILDRASATTFSTPWVCLTLNLKGENRRIHLPRRPISLTRFNSQHRAKLSHCNSNSLCSRYSQHFSQPKMTVGTPFHMYYTYTPEDWGSCRGKEWGPGPHRLSAGARQIWRYHWRQPLIQIPYWNPVFVTREPDTRPA